MILWLGWLPGPHDADITLPAAGLAFGALAAALLLRRWPRSRRQPPADIRRRGALARFTAAGVRSARGGLDDACRLLASGNWKLAGAFGYYAFDNAVLWAAFRAYGRTPPPTVIVMGYLVGSLSTTVPLPATSPPWWRIGSMADRSPWNGAGRFAWSCPGRTVSSRSSGCNASF